MNKLNLQKNIPKDWERLRLGDVADITNGKTNTQDAVSNGEYPLFDRSILVKRSNKFLFDREAIILPGEGAEFIPKYFDGKFDLHQRAYAIFAHENKIYSPFLYQYLFFNRDVFAQTAVGSTVKSLRLPIISKVLVNVPTIKEQKKIAEILSKVDEEINKTDELILKTDELKNGLMNNLFTRGIGHKKFKKTKLGEIPEDWEIRKLEEICDVRDGTHNSPKYHQDGVPLITSKNLTDSGLDFNNIDLISKSDFIEIEKRSHVDDGDILFGMIGTIGNPVLVNKNREFAIKNVALIKFINKGVSNVFILHSLKSNYMLVQFNKKLGGSTQKFIALGKIRELDILVPKYEEQQKISEILSSMDKKLEKQKELKEKLTQLKKGLMSNLLSGKVRINI